eukprot:gnl/TRDRNA2_/TRDRNA2_161753_c1_seq1.p1 gnl/TRDRNA2_/TRDRNA2_161753_c1~~gnl/TRDRNA2_/TRDRNA2_161753_c1_seq1.p1  ORF type:complete len:757 (+),score=121.81 gnl/TRDRNA2_/TRDRNA2_161753_c1_seq1:67-2271(+)
MDGEAGGVFSPVEEGALCLPCDPDTHFAYALTARSALEAAERLQRAPLIALGAWREEAPFWHTPTTVLAACTTERCELFDLVALRLDNSGLWPEASNALRMLLSDAHILKVVYGDDTLHSWATSLGLGIPNTLRQGDRDPLGPTLDLREVVASVLDRPPEDPGCAWPSVARRFLGLRLCPEEANSNWARRPLRNSQLHCAAVEAWTQIPVLLALCAYGVVPRSLIDQLIVLQIKVKQLNKAKVTKHLPGQLAPPGRLAAESAAAQAAQATGMPGTPGAAVAAGAAVVAAAVAAAVAENGPVLPPLPEENFLAQLGKRTCQARSRCQGSRLARSRRLSRLSLGIQPSLTADHSRIYNGFARVTPAAYIAQAPFWRCMLPAARLDGFVHPRSRRIQILQTASLAQPNEPVTGPNLEVRWSAKIDPALDDAEPSEGATTMPLFTLEPRLGQTHLLYSEPMLVIFEPRYRAMYNDILFSGARRFMVCNIDPSTGRLADVGSILYLSDLKEVSERTNDKIKYITQHSVIGRARLLKVLNPRAYKTRETYLRAEVADFKDRDADEDTAEAEADAREMFKDIINMQAELGEGIRFTEDAVSSYSFGRGTGMDDRGLWGAMFLWQQFTKQRASKLHKQMQGDIQNEFKKFLTSNETDVDRVALAMTGEISANDLPESVQKECRTIMRRYNEEIEGMEYDPGVVQAMMQSDSHKERLAIFMHLANKERNRLAACVSLRALFGQ